MTLPIDPAPLYRSLFAAYPDALLLVDFDGTIVLANPFASRLLGYEPDDLVGRPVDHLVPDAIRPRHAAYRDAYRTHPRPRPMGAQMGAQMDLVARRRDGSTVRVEIALSPLADAPYVVAAIRDVGEYPRVRQALQRARYAEQLAQMGRLAVNARDPTELIQAIPPAVASALGIDAVQIHLPDLATGEQRLAAGFGPDFGPQTLPAEVAAAARPITIASETPGHSALGVPILERGHVIGVLSAYAQVADRFGPDEQRLVESLANLLATVLQRAQSDDALRHAQGLETVGQLTGGIAHDFNNLLTVISGNLQVLAEHPTVEADELAQQLVSSALRATGRGAELTAKLLAFSRRQVLHSARIDVGGMLRSLADMLRRTLDQRIGIELEIGRDCPDCLADPGQLESALLNIAVNARDAMPNGGALHFVARRCADLPAPVRADLDREGTLIAPSYAEIAIRDTGSGMPDRVKERAFEPFFTTKEAGRGTGLGLSTVYGFARQSKGGITLDSAPGHGTTVTLYIPAADAIVAPAASTVRDEGRVPAGLRILVVEDEPDVLAIVQHFLTDWQCEVTICRHADEALALLQASAPPFDLLLSDIVSKTGMRGTELAVRGRAARPALATVLMSGYSPELLEQQEPQAAPMPRLLRKPFTRAELAASIADGLDAAQGARARTS